ncbi:hypothetical protein HOF78_01600 [Candidatus Woesearchaeota archaeon]|jgi:hypothetical protein|nr:hypothetical protein [Candidatus Woesearchaeota archaeon]MBT6044800.1 hypothetical protein [Candidatus Woesearchaeota archaeon]
MKEKIAYSMISLIIIAGIFLTYPQMHDMSEMSMSEQTESFISLRESIQDGMRSQHRYKCCLEKPCTLCIEKTPGHGEEAECDCLSDIMNGVHPCGECMGQILEGHGNKFLSKYFAKAIAEKLGEEHTGTIKEIISEKYGISVGDQI